MSEPRRYFILIKTAPHGHWFPPQGWEWDEIDAARTGARKADDLWYGVRLIDGETSERLAF